MCSSLVCVFFHVDNDKNPTDFGYSSFRQKLMRWETKKTRKHLYAAAMRYIWWLDPSRCWAMKPHLWMCGGGDGAGGLVDTKPVRWEESTIVCCTKCWVWSSYNQTYLRKILGIMIWLLPSTVAATTPRFSLLCGPEPKKKTNVKDPCMLFLFVFNCVDISWFGMTWRSLCG